MPQFRAVGFLMIIQAKTQPLVVQVRSSGHLVLSTLEDVGTLFAEIGTEPIGAYILMLGLCLSTVWTRGEGTNLAGL